MGPFVWLIHSVSQAMCNIVFIQMCYLNLQYEEVYSFKILLLLELGSLQACCLSQQGLTTVFPGKIIVRSATHIIY